MARKTKSMVEADRQAAQAAQEAEERLAYPSRLLAAMEEATTKSNFEMTVKGGYFALRDRDERGNYVYSLAYSYNSNTQFVLEDLEDALRMKAEERAESERRYEMKKTALSKLSKEEREVLGLN